MYIELSTYQQARKKIKEKFQKFLPVISSFDLRQLFKDTYTLLMPKSIHAFTT